MRLTLRTMLAYQDSVLEPADAEVLGKKIEESDFASGLAERIRSVAKKLRLDAPKVDGKGMGNDANTVAEYLDSTLPQDHVGDFERICLESNRHLAEVAGCHQVLTLVLGKPADVPDQLRERIYGLGHLGASEGEKSSDAAKGALAGTAASNGHATTVASDTAAAEVPDYLKAGQRSSFWPFLAAIAAAFLVGAIILRMIGPFNSSHPVMTMLGGGTTIADATPTDADPDSAAAIASPTDNGDTGDEAPAPELPPGPPSDSEASEVAPVEPPPAVTPEPSPADNSDVPVPPVVDDGSLPPETPTPAPAPEPMPEPDPDSKPPVVAEAPTGDGIDVGRYISDEQLLARLDRESGAWFLKPSRDVLIAGERLVALPTYRPQVVVPSGVQITFAGETVLQMEPPGESGASRMRVAYGRFLVMAVGAAGAQIDMNLGGIQGIATLVDADSTLAVKVARYLPPGADPEVDEGIAVAELFTTNGRVIWQEEGQDEVDIPADHVRVYEGANPPETLGPFEAPAWIDAKSVPPIDRRAGLLLYDLLEPEKPLNVSLQERLTDRRIEVQNLAARCLGAIDEFKPLLDDLSNPDFASFWFGEIDALRQGLQRGPQTAELLRKSIEGRRSAEAVILYRLLMGFSQEQLEKGGAVQLVKHLESDQVDVRVLTFYNLYSITGAQEFYRPEKRPDQQKGALQNWKERLAKGTIAYKSPPSPLENYKPLAKPDAAGARAPALGPVGGERL